MIAEPDDLLVILAIMAGSAFAAFRVPTRRCGAKVGRLRPGRATARARSLRGLNLGLDFSFFGGDRR